MSPAKSNLMTPVLIGGCVIILISFAIRASFGVFQIPIANEFGWLRSDFSMAIAIQNLAWGIGQPLFGALAEKFGDRGAHHRQQQKHGQYHYGKNHENRLPRHEGQQPLR